MARVLNFSAGPSQLPEPVLRRAAAEMLDYGSSGQSVMEMSHRSRVYEEILERCQSLLRQLMNIPDHYRVLFLQGGGHTQFAMVPLNLMTVSGTADYAITGQWAQRAWEEGARYGDARAVASSKDKTFSYIPELPPQVLNSGADYLHICYNNTIFGTCYREPPTPPQGVPLVADISSCILSGPLEVDKFGLLYAGAQKNLGPAGVTIVILREDLLERIPMAHTPTMLQYKTHADNQSLYNTPPCYNIYLVGLVLEWLRDEMGGVAGIAQLNQQKATLLYDFLDGSRLFRGTVRAEDRSLMNIPFVTSTPALDRQFVAEAEAAGLVNLQGHRMVGGMRASLYNAMPLSGVQTLVDFMADFEAAHAT